VVSTTSNLTPETDLPVIPAPRAADCPLHPPAEFTQWRGEPGLRRAMYQGRPAWVVSRYHDIRAALVDPRLSAETIPGALMPSSSDDNAPVMFADRRSRAPSAAPHDDECLHVQADRCECARRFRNWSISISLR
jgi:cytochrome P450